MAGAESELLDWTAGTPGTVRRASTEAMRAYAAMLAAEIETGRPLHHLHEHVDELLDRAELVMGTSRWGVGIEIGAGTGYAAAALSRRPGVERVYVLEHSRELVERVMPLMFRVSGADERKLIRVVGDFERIDLVDGSLDFAVAFAALHHAENLERAVAELARVVRPGGFAVVLDRYQPDSMTDAELDGLLAFELPKELQQRYGFPEGSHVTRRDVGEHEIRLCEWKATFLRAGFEVHPFMGVDFGGRLLYRAVSVPWRAFLAAFGKRLFLARRRWHVLAAQIPFDNRWLLREAEPDGAVNLLMVCRRA